MSELLEILKPGPFTSVQAQPRQNVADLGISPGGAADFFALRIGNHLLGNPPDAAALELTISGGEYLFHGATWIVLAGSEFAASIDDIPLATWQTFYIRAGQVLRVGPTRAGARCYLCLRDGLHLPKVLGSSATFLAASFGGLEGRLLTTGDRIEFTPSKREDFQPKRLGFSGRKLWATVKELRIVKGPQWTWFSEVAQKRLLTSSFQVSTETNRSGVRLKGEELQTKISSQLLTEGVANGAIQVPGNGQPILLYCEQQTTGGYPKIGHIITADLFRLGQLKPGDEIRFTEVSLQEAWRLHREQEKAWKSWIQNL